MTWLTDDDLDYFWLGPVGGLRQMPLMPVRGSTDATEELIGGLFQAADGTGTLQVRGHRRSWELDWSCLTPVELAPAHAMFQGLQRSALRVVDPRAGNRLSRNGAAGGCYSRDATGFTVTAGSLAFSAVTDYPATYAGLLDGGIAWSVPVSTAATLRVDDTLRVPLIVGEPVTVSMLVKGTLGAQVGVRQYNAAGATTDSLASSVTLGSWALLTHILTPTSDKVSGSLALTVASGAARTVTVGPAVWHPTSTTWCPGTGCPVVLPTKMPWSYPGLANINAGMTLQEA